MAIDPSPTRDAARVERDARRALKRLLPRIERELFASISADPAGWQVFSQRLGAHFPALFELYLSLYQTSYDFFFHLEDLLVSLARAWFQRPDDTARNTANFDLVKEPIAPVILRRRSFAAAL